MLPQNALRERGADTRDTRSALTSASVREQCTAGARRAPGARASQGLEVCGRMWAAYKRPPGLLNGFFGACAYMVWHGIRCPVVVDRERRPATAGAVPAHRALPLVSLKRNVSQARSYSITHSHIDMGP